ncbi:MAG: element excision factor XisI family protein [Nostoc sp.]|uniref:element excision factor XisI family protein n=1 Tax=Nostoc sp. TaxID=1180 RepID=UPI002FF7A487
MADLDKYRKCIRQLITEYAQRASSNNEIEAQTIFDVEQDHYQLIYIGWQNRHRVFRIKFMYKKFQMREQIIKSISATSAFS